MKYRDNSILWARKVMGSSAEYLILDTETTGLEWGSEVIQLAILGLTKPEESAQWMIKPTLPIPPESTAIHGITDEMVAGSCTWKDTFPLFMSVIEGRKVITYNARYDRNMIRSTCEMNNIPMPDLLGWECAMEWYAVYFGDWNQYRHSYRWQKLRGGDHTALGDCRATLTLIQRMAASPLSSEVSHA